MCGRPYVLRVVFLLSGFMPALMGLTCVPSPPDTVTIELANYTDYQIEPRLFIEPTPGTADPEQLIIDENWLFVDPPLQPKELATFEFRCEDVGTLTSDYAEMFISDTEYIPSENAPWLDNGFDFTCGDTITFSFIDDGTIFSTRVEVNGQLLTE